MGGKLYRIAMTLMIMGMVLLAWLSLGVGIVGKDGDPANLMYFGVIAVGIVGAIFARLKAQGLARTLFAMAGVQALITVVALIAGLGLPWSGPAEIVLLNGFFIALFTGTAFLFQRAAP